MQVQQFQKRPVVIEAVRVPSKPTTEFSSPKPATLEVVEWITSNGGQAYAALGGIVIETLEGNMLASFSDWVIRGVQGEFYPCKPDIFAATYDRVPADRHPVA